VRSSDSIAKLAPDLVKLQGELSNPKVNKTNPHFNKKYAGLDAVTDVIRPVAAKYNFAIVQEPSNANGAVLITTRLIHTSGEWLELSPLFLVPDKNTPQGVGSAITYGRRYTESGLFNVASEDDDDGNGAEPAKAPSRKPPTAKPKEAAKPKESGGPSEPQIRALKGLGYQLGYREKDQNDVGWWTPTFMDILQNQYGVDEIDELTGGAGGTASHLISALTKQADEARKAKEAEHGV
jgi:hypothetical protein